ncbi:MAG: DpnD/PcfM family protein [Bacilli bacterium]|nr:DpnD/PcfM family protein [Bacilli bacterium]
MIYKVEITETLQKTVEIEAESLDEAIKIVKKCYYQCEYILDYSNYFNTEFDLINDNL